MALEVQQNGTASGDALKSENRCNDSGASMDIFSASELLRVLQGVLVAAKINEDDAAPVHQWFSDPATFTPQSVQADQALIALQDWCSKAETKFRGEDDARHISLITIGITFLRVMGRKGAQVQTNELDIVWSIVRDALDVVPESKLHWVASRSAQGFISVALCSLIKDGNIDELFRLHVWMPDGFRGNPDFAVHSHQAFAQGWILAGEGKDTPYKVEYDTSLGEATHARYALAWTDGKDKGNSTYKTHQQSSTVVNTGDFMRIEKQKSTIQTRGMSYTIPEASFHTSTIQSDVLHATFFFFDASRGFIKDAPVLGPKDAQSFTQIRDPAGITPAQLVNRVDAVRKWEVFMARGRYHMDRAGWEHALRELNSALHLCQSEKGFPNAQRYICIVHGELGNTYRRFGRYDQAESHLRKAIDGLGVCTERVEFSGELGVLYRHMNRVSEARLAFLDQYETAKALGFDRPTCRAVGNLGMVYYQLFGETGDTNLLHKAIQYLNERIERARRLQDEEQNLDFDGGAERRRRQAHTWEIIGLSRLSLCHSARKDNKAAIETSLKALELTEASKDTTVIAVSRLFYGFALLKDGQRDEALQQFNPPYGCTPAMALCKEPSEEHRQYLHELIDAGADLDLVDEHGYTALDYAVFSGDTKMEALVLEGLRKVPGYTEEGIIRRQSEAMLRKGYRELFQEELRPVLLGGGRDSIEKLRIRYAEELAKDKRKSDMFDQLKFLRYSDFVKFGKFPRSDDSVTETFAPESEHYAGEYIVFISYRWLKVANVTTSPDDQNNTQYNRVIAAVERLLQLHPDISPSRLSIWLDYACVDQEGPAKGVAALPMILAQCNAVVSLVDDEYYTRAWCSVEVMMVQTLKKSYHLHEWYEQTREDGGQGLPQWILRPGPMDIVITMADKRVTLEEDRAKTLFLERQTRLLGTS
ncbi:hypothetical protein jhhlp_000794 [Lomentospora prolificans]|uniref:Uncharacterized protein n=1 Tax=Lomentospora prolificans TaxID=41688 RepID=A0A2N3NJG2_9PEZI|nr:hypothetical protein jhhlp_000794 [Lomentospora prolificans]